MREKHPFFFLAAVASVVTFVVQQQEGAVKTVQKLPLGTRSGNALISYCRYLEKLFWPTDLAVLYPHPGHWPLEKVLLAGGLILGISALLFVRRRRYPFLLMGWLWFCGTLVPVIGLVQVGDQAMADRYTYLPSLGVLILVIWGAYRLTRRWRYRVMALSVAGSAALVLCLALTRQQLGHWQDSETLFRHALEVTGNNDIAHLNLGNALEKKGRIGEAISQFQEALRLSPHFADAHYNLGEALDKQGQMDEAIGQYQEALRLKPRFRRRPQQLGLLAPQKRTGGRVRSPTPAKRLDLQPSCVDAYNNLGRGLLQKGQIDEALAAFQAALELRPRNAAAHNNLGKALLLKGREDQAIAHFQEALAIQPDNAPAHNNLATLLLQRGQVGQAMAHYQAAVEIQPDNAAILSSVAWVLATCPEASARNGARALELAQHAARLSGRSNPWILATLAAACAEAGQFPEAVATAREALGLVNAQPNTTLSNLLQIQIGLYQTGGAFRDPDQIRAAPKP